MGLLSNDNASPEIIAQTAPWVHQHVRLYFRPRTPTFYHNEGIRPAEQRSLNAHCPVPVAFLLDAKTVLGMSRSQFSNGNLARRNQATLGGTAAQFEALPFDDIYHDHSTYGYTEDRKNQLTFHRQAEAVIPDELPLHNLLKAVFVCSAAERETLISLVETNGLSTLPFAIRINTRQPLFYRQWAYVEAVSLQHRRITVRFNSLPRIREPFRFTVEIAHRWGDLAPYAIEERNYYIRDPWNVTLPDRFWDRTFVCRIHLDECLAYFHEFEPLDDITLFDVPF